MSWRRRWRPRQPWRTRRRRSDPVLCGPSVMPSLLWPAPCCGRGALSRCSRPLRSSACNTVAVCAQQSRGFGRQLCRRLLPCCRLMWDLSTFCILAEHCAQRLGGMCPPNGVQRMLQEWESNCPNGDGKGYNEGLSKNISKQGKKSEKNVLHAEKRPGWRSRSLVATVLSLERAKEPRRPRRHRRQAQQAKTAVDCVVD